MKLKQRVFNLLFGFAILFFVFSMSLLFITIKHYYFEKPQTMIEKKERKAADAYSDVIKYIPSLRAELKQYHLEKYTVALAAVMHQESRGKGGDPMQSSESAGLPPNTIDDPNMSIKQGVKHFHRVVSYGRKKKVDFPAMIQAYNMGLGYISYISEHGGHHSEKLAKEFSMIQVKKNPAVYNCGGDQDNFRYPYCYGDYSYSSKVAKNIDMMTDIVTSKLDKEKTAEAY